MCREKGMVLFLAVRMGTEYQFEELRVDSGIQEAAGE